MRNSMIVKHGSENLEHFICPCLDCKPDPDEEMPVFYSYQHAIDFGWIKTKECKYCEPGKQFVFVCPQCYNGV